MLSVLLRLKYLPLWYLLVMMLSVLLWLMSYPFGIFWSWCCLYFFDCRLTPLISFGHDVVCTFAIDDLLLWYVLVMMWSVLVRLTGLPLWYVLVMMLSVLLRLTVLPLWYLLVMMFSVLVRLTGLPLWYLLVMMLSVVLPLTAYSFGICWSWCCLYFFDWQLTPLVSFGHDVVCTSSIDSLPLWYLLVMMWSVLLRLTAYPLVSFGHDVVCTSAIDVLPLWYLLVMMLSVLLRLTAYPFGISWSWCCLYFKGVSRQSKLSIEVQTTSWPKDTKGVSRQSKKYRQHHDQKIPKG